MCEMLVRTVSKTNPDDPYKCCQLTKRGDVIVVQEDGWPWGKEEVTAPFWTIVKMPGLPAREAAHFLAPELPLGKEPDKMLQRRAFKIDLDALGMAEPQDVKCARECAHIEIKAVPTAIQKARLDDPAILGPQANDRSVIG